AQKKSLSDFNNIFPYLRRNNYGYLALDLRGHGESIYNLKETTETYKSFSLSGADNQFNKMARDIEGAIKFLESEEIPKERLIVMGAILGANLAIKTAAIHQEVRGVVTLSAVLNVNDVLSVNPLKAYGERPLLCITGTDNKRQYKEFQLLTNIAKITAGEENVTTVIAKRGFGSKLLSYTAIKKILAWVENPKLPTIVNSSTSTITIPFFEPEYMEFEDMTQENTIAENEIPQTSLDTEDSIENE
ncbi:MAG: alpha/beta hydrolase, partial [Elusimicrobiota bacterium]|nr:alpha/beta hydrolase [Elusimicrobiota bacterium]